MKRLIASALEFAALNRIDYPLHMETFLLAELIADIGAKFAGRAEQFGRKLIIDVEPSDRNRPCHADPFLIERALDNLIDNAILHARGADRITVAMRRAGTTQEVCVSDNGCGIAEAFVGEPDAETEASSPARRTGRGLGIVKRIAMLHGGTWLSPRPLPAEPRSPCKFRTDWHEPAHENRTRCPPRNWQCVVTKQHPAPHRQNLICASPAFLSFAHPQLVVLQKIDPDLCIRRVRPSATSGPIIQYRGETQTCESN